MQEPSRAEVVQWLQSKVQQLEKTLQNSRQPGLNDAVRYDLAYAQATLKLLGARRRSVSEQKGGPVLPRPSQCQRINKRGSNGSPAYDQQDSVGLIQSDSKQHLWNVLGVFDGHGVNGSLVSRALVEEFLPLLQKNLGRVPPQEEKKVREIIQRTFHQYDQKSFADLTKREVWDQSGSTAAVCVCRDKHLYLAHVGDSRILLFDMDGDIKASTVDHKPDHILEHSRITKAGGHLNYQDGFGRVVSKEMCDKGMGGYAVSRVFGDFVGKIHQGRYSAECAPMSVDPTIVHKVIDGPHLLMLCTDGVFEPKTMTNTRVQSRVKQELGKGSSQHLSDILAAEAQSEGSTDDITILCVPVY